MITQELRPDKLRWKHRMPLWVRIPAAIMLLGLIFFLLGLLVVEATAVWTFFTSL